MIPPASPSSPTSSAPIPGARAAEPGAEAADATVGGDAYDPDRMMSAPGDGSGLRAEKKRRARMAMHRAALELVAEHGMSGVTVEMIAERAGVSPRTFFNYWETKEAAVLGLVQDRVALGVQLLSERPLEEEPHLSMRAVITEMARHLPSDQELRLLKRRALEREATLNMASMGNLFAVQGALVDTLESRLRAAARTVADAAQAGTRARLCVQLAFAAARTAFSQSMAHGTSPVEELQRVYALIDSGRAGA